MVIHHLLNNMSLLTRLLGQIFTYINRNIIRNISDEEFHARKILRKNKDIIIGRADKGNTTAIMDKKDYIGKI